MENDLELPVENACDLYIWVTFYVIASFLFKFVNTEAEARKVVIFLHSASALLYYLCGYIIFSLLSKIFHTLASYAW